MALIRDNDIARFLLDLDDVFRENSWESETSIATPRTLHDLLHPMHRLVYVHPDRPSTQIEFVQDPSTPACERFRVYVYRDIPDAPHDLEGSDEGTRHGIVGFIPHESEDLELIRETITRIILK